MPDWQADPQQVLTYHHKTAIRNKVRLVRARIVRGGVADAVLQQQFLGNSHKLSLSRFSLNIVTTIYARVLDWEDFMTLQPETFSAVVRIYSGSLVTHWEAFFLGSGVMILLAFIEHLH